MSTALRTIAIMAACSLTLALSGAEKVFVDQNNDDFKANARQGRSWKEDNLLKLSLPTSTQVMPGFTLTPGKTYTLSAEIKSLSGAGVKGQATKGSVGICFVSEMKNGKPITSQESNRIFPELAEVVKPVKVGDASIIVKGNIDRWYNVSDMPLLIAVGAKEDNSDLPNNNLIKLGSNGIKKLADGNWEIKIEEAGRRNIQQNIAVGTKLGVHYFLNLYDFIPEKKAEPDWTKFSGTLKFTDKHPTPVFVAIYCDDDDGQIAVRNLKVIEK